jgi:CO/xanthine dehydrogenase Mo-binding subunit
LGEAQLVLAKCENWFLDSHIAVTNRQQAGVVRGYGGQELNSCLEKLLCAIMREGNFNPLDVFKKNYVSHGDKYIWRDGRTYRSRSSFFFPEVMQETADRFGWSKKWKGWFKPTSVNVTRARGVGMGVIGNCDIQEDNTEAIVRIIPSLEVSNVGSGASFVVVECDITESGMGQRSNACKVVAEVFNCPYEWVSITDPGSRNNPSNFGLCGSRGTITTGKAVTEAALMRRRRRWSWRPLSWTARPISSTCGTWWSTCATRRRSAFRSAGWPTESFLSSVTASTWRSSTAQAV